MSTRWTTKVSYPQIYGFTHNSGVIPITTYLVQIWPNLYHMRPYRLDFGVDWRGVESGGGDIKMLLVRAFQVVLLVQQPCVFAR